MRFLLDAQLPRRAAQFLSAAGHDSIHTLDLSKKNRTPDDEIIRIADTQDRIVATKDEDFVDSHLLRHEPRKLLLISTGNTSNAGLLTLLQSQLEALEAAFQEVDYVELTPNSVIAHR